MKKILIVTKHYLSHQSGGSNGSRAYIKALQRIYGSMTLIYPEDAHDPMPHLFGEEGVHYIPCVDHRSKIQKGLDVYRGKIHRFLPKVKEVLAQESFDIVFIDHSSIANGVLRYVRKHTQVKVVTIHHNVEADYIKDNPFPRFIHWPMAYFSCKAECEALTQSDLGVTVTQHDCDTFLERYQVPEGKLAAFGAFFDADISNADFQASTSRIPGNLVVTSSLNFMQNIQPIVRFLTDYYPKVKAAFPEIRLTIAGRAPGEELRTICARYPDVTLIPSPADMGSILDQGAVYLCLTDMGSGIKMRVFDGLSHGLPAIVHQQSLWGYEPMVEQGVVLPYHDVESFIEVLSQLQSRNIEPAEVRKAFASYYSLSAGCERFRQALTGAHLI